MRRPFPYLLAFLFLLLGACAEQPDQVDSASADDSATEAANEAVMARLYEVINTGDLSYVDEIMVPDVIEHQMMPGTTAEGSEAFRETVTMLRESFPDIRITTDEMIAEGDLVATLFTMSGTQTGPMMDAPASGNHFQITGLDLVRFEAGKAVEHWGFQEEMSMMEQLGMMPPAEEQPGATEPPVEAEPSAQVEQPVE